MMLPFLMLFVTYSKYEGTLSMTFIKSNMRKVVFLLQAITCHQPIRCVFLSHQENQTSPLEA